ncbi:MAG: 2OG-Fe(II) oxygenase [Chitinophagales bacterium]|nr:2OG-Fe(II) oxygenase [Chitinophagales bacterium]MDW8419035.1 2OG-Fe(II) oxygenase [Chitinophagales bacterium]
MNLIDIDSLYERLPHLRTSFQAQKPFRFIHIPRFFKDEAAEEILATYPDVHTGNWDATTYIHQVNKFTLNKFESGSLLQRVFDEMNGDTFRDWLEQLTGIEGLIPDHTLFGAGLHQSVRGAQLDVHVDYNIHPYTKLHRRLNVLVYMNKNWKPEYKGDVEFWEITKQSRRLIARYPPGFNECIIFETNERSFHGHPEPLNTPAGISRKSLAVYYYTQDRPAAEIAEEHNTIFVNTRGWRGELHRLLNASRALAERLYNKLSGK